MTNAQWHKDNPVPIYPRSAFPGWHLRHEAVCACRPTPEAVLRALDDLGIVTPGRIERMLVPATMPDRPGPQRQARQGPVNAGPWRNRRLGR